MSDGFMERRGGTAALLPQAPAALIDSWRFVQRAMVRTRAPEFTRDEWAYLISFLDERNLASAMALLFRDPEEASLRRLVRPRGTVALWLPNNVSLLGCLAVVLLTLTGNKVQVKAGSRSDDLCSLFVSWVEALGGDAAGLVERVTVARFDRQDPRNAAMAAAADVRIIFGSDEAAEAVDRLPHPVASTAYHFTDRRSEAWLAPGAAEDPMVRAELLKAFGIFGTAGCTSPRRALVLGGSPSDALGLARRLAAEWPGVHREGPPMHVASEVTMCDQWGRGCGWDTFVAADRGALFAVRNSPAAADVTGLRFLEVGVASLDEAARTMPRNIQTIGHALDTTALGSVAVRVASHSNATRIVPLRKMHDFGPVWDGFRWWEGCFEEVEVR